MTLQTHLGKIKTTSVLGLKSEYIKKGLQVVLDGEICEVISLEAGDSKVKVKSLIGNDEYQVDIKELGILSVEYELSGATHQTVLVNSDWRVAINCDWIGVDVEVVFEVQWFNSTTKQLAYFLPEITGLNDNDGCYRVAKLTSQWIREVKQGSLHFPMFFYRDDPQEITEALQVTAMSGMADNNGTPDELILNRSFADGTHNRLVYKLQK